MRIWSQYPPLVSPKDVFCGLTCYDAMRNSNVVTSHTVLVGKSDEGHISKEPQTSGWPQFCVPSNLARSFDLRDIGNIDTAEQDTGFSCRVS